MTKRHSADWERSIDVLDWVRFARRFFSRAVELNGRVDFRGVVAKPEVRGRRALRAGGRNERLELLATGLSSTVERNQLSARRKRSGWKLAIVVGGSSAPILPAASRGVLNVEVLASFEIVLAFATFVVEAYHRVFFSHHSFLCKQILRWRKREYCRNDKRAQSYYHTRFDIVVKWLSSCVRGAGKMSFRNCFTII